MKFKISLIKRKIILIILLLLLVISGIVLFFLFNKAEYNSSKSGQAAFYEYPSTESDSLVKLMSDERKTEILIFLSQSKLQTDNSEDITNQFSGLFFENFADSLLLEEIKSIKKHKSFVKVISEEILFNFSTDSLFFIPTNFLYTINDSLTLCQYYDYQTQQLKNLGINAVIVNLEFPEIIDPVSVLNISSRMKILLNILHRNKILSYVSIAEIPDEKIKSNKENYQNILNSLFDCNLCGIIFKNHSDLNKTNLTNFDGIKIIRLSMGQIPEKSTASAFDAFIADSNEDRYIYELRKKVKKHNTKEELFFKSSKILRAGMWSNQTNRETTCEDKNFNIKLLDSKITEASITVLKNENKLIPLIEIDQKIHLVFATKSNFNEFLSTFSKYSSNYTISYFNLKSEKAPAISTSANTLIIIYESESIDSIPSALLKSMSGFSKNTIFVNIGKIPKGIMEVPAESIFQVYTASKTAFSFSAQLIFGGIAASGTLASKINDTVSYGYGIQTTKTRLKYSMPEDARLNSEKLKGIDSIINFAISSGAMPGCQVFVAKSGIVVYDKSFGYLDYSKTNSVDNSDLYDVASLTKICATTLAMMKMVETGKIKLDDKLEKYFKNTRIDYGKIKPDTVTIIDTINIKGKTKLEIKDLVVNKDTIHLNDTMLRRMEIFVTKTTPSANIFQVPIRSLLVHQSGISPSLPILPYMFYEDSFSKWKYRENLKSDTLNNEKKRYSRQEAWDYYYCDKWVKDSAEVQIADKMYLRNRWSDSLYEDIKRLGTFNRSTYQYTDVNMILVQAIIDTVNHKSIDKFIKEEFYEELGMNNTTFTPLNFNIPKGRIAPTESESYWRKQVIHGTVHDPSAAMLGGISGNAGLFSTASDLGILGQMWLNDGTYGGKRYLNKNTIKMFTAKQAENNRGLGFDKAAARNLNARSAPISSYGHTGFTGCIIWVDPENEIVFVFLSNRLHPDVKNWKILGQKVLQNVHQVVYDAMEE